jgi:hypothetical protein
MNQHPLASAILVVFFEVGPLIQLYNLVFKGRCCEGRRAGWVVVESKWALWVRVAFWTAVAVVIAVLGVRGVI